MTSLSRIAAFSAATVIAATVLAGQAAAKTLSYTVLRDGQNIGTHSFDINQNGATTEVDIKTDIKVKVLFVTAYKFEHTSKEMWANGQLMSINSTTDDDGTPKALKVAANGAKLTIDGTVKGQERRQHADAPIIPASLWNPEIVKQTQILNTLDGTIMSVSVEDKGLSEVEAGGAKQQAHHYAITGELTRELWFTPAGDLVQIRFPDKTGTEIVYTLN